MSETLQQTDAPAWTDWVTNFGAAYDQFQTNYSALLAVGPQVSSSGNPDLMAQYQSILTDASAMANQLAPWEATWNTVSQWLGTISQAEGAGYYTASAPSGFSGFGQGSIIWTIGQSLFAATLVLSTLSNITTRITQMLQYVTVFLAAKAQGATTDDANAAAHSAVGPINTGSLLSTGPSFSTLIFIGVLIWLAPSIINAFVGKKS